MPLISDNSNRARGLQNRARDFNENSRDRANGNGANGNGANGANQNSRDYSRDRAGQNFAQHQNPRTQNQSQNPALTALARAFADFWSPKILLYSTLPFLCSLVVFSQLFGWAGAGLSEAFAQWAAAHDSGVLGVLNAPAVQFCVRAFLWLAQAALAVLFAYFAALVVVCLLTPALARRVAGRYGGLPRELPTTAAQIGAFAAAFGRFVKIALLCAVALILPFVNLVVFHVPFYYFFYKSMQADVYANTRSSQDFAELLRGERDGAFKGLCVLFYIIALVPFVGAFLQVFAVLALCHLSFLTRENDENDECFTAVSSPNSNLPQRAR